MASLGRLELKVRNVATLALCFVGLVVCKHAKMHIS
jgi:hypothetical protein